MTTHDERLSTFRLNRENCEILKDRQHSLKYVVERFHSKIRFFEGQVSYELTIMELGTKIDDLHGYIQIPKNKLEETVLAPMYAKNRVPVELIQSREGHIVVKKPEVSFSNLVISLYR